MEKVFIIIKFSEENVVLYNDELNREFLWPKEFLPVDSKVGDKINFLISLDDIEKTVRKQRAKDVLNEILMVDEN
ncbi:MAG TPA: hypothetical protein PLE28_01060 [bacterium]|nr:hypothetical protein [bacterium]